MLLHHPNRNSEILIMLALLYAFFIIIAQRQVCFFPVSYCSRGDACMFEHQLLQRIISVSK